VLPLVRISRRNSYVSIKNWNAEALLDNKSPKTGALFRNTLYNNIINSAMFKYIKIKFGKLLSSPTTHLWRRRRDRIYSSYSFTASALDTHLVSGERHAPAELYFGERTPGTHCTGGWVGFRAGVDAEDRGEILLPLLGIEPRSPGRPVRSQILYWMSYPVLLGNC
jgi:hypothetical protein